MKNKIAFVVLMIIIAKSYSQEQVYKLEDLGIKYSTTESISNSSKIDIICDNKLVQILNLSYNFYSTQKIKKYTILIYFGTGSSGKNEAQKNLNNFKNKYPNIPATIVFEEPYFKVKVGNFSTKKDAEVFLHKIKKDFKGAFILEE